MALATTGGTQYGSLDVEPFGLIKSSTEVEEIAKEVQREGNFPALQPIEDAFPAHIVQEAFMKSTTNFPGTLMAKRVYRIPEHVDIAKFKGAWEAVVEHFPNLRTRIIPHHGSPIQAVLKGVQDWEDTKGHGVRSFIESRMEMNMGYGSTLSRHGIVEEDGEKFFVWIHHHAVVDGWTLGLVVTALHQAYFGVDLPKLGNFAGFVKFARSIDNKAAAEFWRNQLEGAKQTTWPPPAAPGTPYKGVTEVASRFVKLPDTLNTSMTLATIMTGAWAIALAQNDNSSDVTFTHTSSGRQAPLKGLDTVAGITTARVPVRVRIDNNQSVAAFLSDIQKTASDTVAYEHFGVQNIANMLPDVAPAVLQPTSLVALQPAKERDADETLTKDAILAGAFDKYSSADQADGFHLAPLVTHCFLGDGNIDIHSNYNREVINASQLEAMNDQLERIILELCNNPDKTLGSFFS